MKWLEEIRKGREGRGGREANEKKGMWKGGGNKPHLLWRDARPWEAGYMGEVIRGREREGGRWEENGREGRRGRVRGVRMRRGTLPKRTPIPQILDPPGILIALQR